MYFSDIVKRSGRSLKSAKLRTILTALAISVGAFTLSITLAASNGLHSYTNKLITSNFDPSELLVGRDKAVGSGSALTSEPQEYDPSVSAVQVGAKGSVQIKKISEDEAQKLRTVSYISQTNRRGFDYRDGEQPATYDRVVQLCTCPSRRNIRTDAPEALTILFDLPHVQRCCHGP